MKTCIIGCMALIFFARLVLLQASISEMESQNTPEKRLKLDNELLECGLVDSPSLLAGYGLSSQVSRTVVSLNRNFL